MQRGSLALVSRKEGPAVWQFRWSEKATLGALRNPREVLLHPNCTQILA